MPVLLRWVSEHSIMLTYYYVPDLQLILILKQLSLFFFLIETPLFIKGDHSKFTNKKTKAQQDEGTHGSLLAGNCYRQIRLNLPDSNVLGLTKGHSASPSSMVHPHPTPTSVNTLFTSKPRTVFCDHRPPFRKWNLRVSDTN